MWPWPLNIRHEPGLRVYRRSLPIQRHAHLRHGYAKHPRSPHRTPLESYEYLRAAFRTRAERRATPGVYTIVDFLYEFRVWANYQDVDTVLALWGPGYRSFIDMNLSVLVFFIGGCVELAFASTQGQTAYSTELQRIYDSFVSRDDTLRGEFPNSPLYQRLQVYRGKGLVTADIALRSEPNPHRVNIIGAEVV